MTKRLALPFNWRPRPYQEGLWYYLRDGGKRAVACWHRRAGKDEICLHTSAAAAMERPGNYWHMLPEYSQARKAIWDAVNPHTGKRRVDEAFPHEIRRFTREHEMMIGLGNGSTWQVVGSDNYNSLMGTTPAGMILSEYALSNPSAWGYLSPILEENNGWAAFISTPRGRNHFHGMTLTAQREKDWHYSLLTNDDTKVFTQEQLDSKLRELMDIHPAQYALSLWKQEYFCSFDAAIPGSIWGDCVERAKNEGRIVDFDIDVSQPVYTGWDLGRTDDTAIWFYQFCGTQIDVIDHFSSAMMDINNEVEPKNGLVQMLLAKAKQHGFRYQRHWLPHDARPRTLAAGGKSILQQFHDARDKHPELGDFAIVKRLDRQEGIQAGRATFPHVRFHATNCARGLLSLKHYHRQWDDDKKMFTDDPVHDWCLAPETEVLTRYGTRQIMNLPKTGEVLTSCGWKRYQNPRITRRNAPLVEVTFASGYMVQCTPDHLFWTESGWTFAANLTVNTPILSSLTRSRSISMAVYTACGRVRNIFRAAGKNCTERLGKWPSAQFLRDAIFITGMAIRRTMRSAIWSAFPLASTYPRTPNTSQENAHKRERNTSRKVRAKPLPHGIVPTLAECGIVATWNASNHGLNGSASPKIASIAMFAFRVSREIADRIKDSVLPPARWLRIESVRSIERTSDVWCITVPGIADFSLANGAIVHNSSHDSDAWRSVALSWKFPKQKSADEPAPQDALMKQSVNVASFGHLKKKHLSKMRDKRAAAL